MKSTQNQKLKTDCFAYNSEKNRCNALSEFVCTYKNCSFYRNKTEIDTKEIEKSIKHYGCSNE